MQGVLFSKLMISIGMLQMTGPFSPGGPQSPTPPGTPKVPPAPPKKSGGPPKPPTSGQKPPKTGPLSILPPSPDLPHPPLQGGLVGPAGVLPPLPGIKNPHEVYGIVIDKLETMPVKGKGTTSVKISMKSKDVTYTRIIWRNAYTLREIESSTKKQKEGYTSSIEVNPTKIRFFFIDLFAMTGSGNFVWSTLSFNIPEKDPNGSLEYIAAPSIDFKPKGPLVYTKGQETKIKVRAPMSERFTLSHRMSSDGKKSIKHRLPRKDSKYMKYKMSLDRGWNTWDITVNTNSLNLTGFMTYTAIRPAQSSRVTSYQVELNQFIKPEGVKDMFSKDYASVRPFTYDALCTSEGLCDASCIAFGNDLARLDVYKGTTLDNSTLLDSMVSPKDVKTPMLVAFPFFKVPKTGKFVYYTCRVTTTSGIVKKRRTGVKIEKPKEKPKTAKPKQKEANST